MRRVALTPYLALPLLLAGAALSDHPGAAAAESAPAATTPHLREFTLGGARVTLDLAPQILSIDSPPRPAEPSVETTPGGAYDGAFVPAALLVQKAKQFDDGLYAAVELAAQDGAGDFGGKRALLDALALALADKPTNDGASVTIESAALLGGGAQTLPPAMQRAAAKATLEFQNQPLRSKPIGFYTDSPQLGAIFRQDRMLQGGLALPGAATVAERLHADANLRRTYEDYLALTGGLTNPPETGKADLRPLLAALDTGAALPEVKSIAFFPPSRAPETDLLKRLFGPDQQIPENFSLIEEMARQLRAGTLDLTPTPRSGWYDWAIWALEPLAVPERAAEAAKLQLNAAYRKDLTDLFQGTLALTRETHIKNLGVPVETGAAARMPEPVLYVTPQLRAEPLATYYRRRAQGYRFVAGVLQRTFGAAALDQMHRTTPKGNVPASLAQELAQMQALFLGAYAAVCEDLGITPEDGAETQVAAFEAWRAQLSKDADLKRDARMMVPLYFDAQRHRIQVLVFLGWTQRFVEIGFAATPRVTALVADPAGASRDAPAPTEVRFARRYETLYYPVSAEILVPRLLDRDQFRALCDEKRSVSAILQALQH